jgi:two-component system sensor histidine kinase/response regulator
MSTNWVEQLNYAACECNDDVILELIAQIPAENASLANVLKDLANNFEFQKIMELTQ